MASLPRLLPLSLLAASLLGGCSGDVSTMFANSGLSTASVEKPAADPACVALNAKIDGLRKEGVSDRAAQAASASKASTVQVKRASLAQLAELDKANAEFQSKCSTLGPRPMTAAAPSPVQAAAAPAATAQAKVAAAKPAGAGAPAAE